MAQSVGRLTLDFISSHDPRVVALNPVPGSALSMERYYLSLSLSHSVPLPTHVAVALSLIKVFKKHMFPHEGITKRGDVNEHIRLDIQPVKPGLRHLIH